MTYVYWWLSGAPLVWWIEKHGYDECVINVSYVVYPHVK